MKSKKSIDEFLSNKNVAVVGVSSHGKGFGVLVFRHLKKSGYIVYCVNKNGGIIDGEILFKNLSEIPQKVDAVVTVIPPSETEKLIPELVSLSIKNIWMQQGSESESAIEYCQENNLNVVSGQCIMMYAEPVKSIHSFHRWFNRLVGKYPD